MSDRFLFAELADAGILLDLETGSYFRISREGYEIGRRIVASGDTSLLPIEKHAARRASSTLSVDRVDQGYLLSWQGEPVRWIGSRGASVRSVTNRLDPEQTLLWTVPHILALKGYTILHASCVRLGDHVIAISGPSGAGKSTLAEALIVAGGEQVADDLLPILGKRKAWVLLDGEMKIREWVRANARADEVDTSLLDPGVANCMPLESIWHVDAERRTGETIGITVPDSSEAMCVLLANSFAEVNDREVWRRVFESSHRLHPLVCMVEVPLGVDRVRAAACTYRNSVESS